MSDNYSSWRIDFREFYSLKSGEDRIKFLLRFALLAPSSHNSQPWRFAVKGDQIIVYPEEKRALPESDMNDRQLFISLGAALENLLTAAKFYDYNCEVSYFPAEFTGAAVVVKLEESAIIKSNDAMIFNSIISRHTNRNKYSNKQLSDRFLDSLKSMSGEDFKIHIIHKKKLKDEIAVVVTDAIIEAMDDKGFRSELSQYIRSNITKAKTGMPMFGFGMPTPLSLIASHILKRFNLNRLSRKEDEALLKDHTPYFGVISSSADDKEAWIRSGQIYERIALMAEREGIRTAPMAAAIQIGGHHKKLQKILNLHTRPQVFFRMGYSELLTHHSPRLTLEEVLEK